MTVDEQIRQLQSDNLKIKDILTLLSVALRELLGGSETQTKTINLSGGECRGEVVSAPLTITQAASLGYASRATIYRRIAFVPTTIKVGHARWLNKEDFVRWLQKARVEEEVVMVKHRIQIARGKKLHVVSEERGVTGADLHASALGHTLLTGSNAELKALRKSLRDITRKENKNVSK